MSDTKEIHLGREGVSTFINTHGARLKSALDAVDLGLYDDLIMFWNAEAYIHINKTFIASFTPHALLDEGGSAYHRENYGSVALYLDPAVLRNGPSDLALFLRPVTYGEAELNNSLVKMLETVEGNIELLRSVDKGILLSFLRHQLFFASVSTKAEAFSDEKEWRIIYTPWQFASAHIVCSDEFTTQNQRCDLPLTKDDGTSWFEIRKIDRK